METSEFDVMLTELEQELEAMAPSKDEGKIGTFSFSCSLTILSRRSCLISAQNYWNSCFCLFRR
jgi:hypothetical protein